MHSRALAATAAVLLLTAWPAGCSSSSSPEASTTTGPTATSTRTTIEPAVLVISVDGLSPEALRRLGRPKLPTFARLILEGVSTLEARTAVERTITLPNHAGMLTGRRVAGDDGTSVTFNDDTGRTLEAAHGSYVPGMFDVAHDRGLSTAFFAEKDKFGFLMRSWDDQHGALDETGTDEGRDKVDRQAIGDADAMAADVVEALEAGTDLTFWHLAAPDRAGHAHGWLSTRYLAAVRETDRRLGELLAWLDEHPAVGERLTIVLTSDHGGPEGRRTHDDATLAANFTVPFVAWGRGVAEGADLYDLNRARRHPGTKQPGYSGAQPVRNLDAANLALQLLGLPHRLGLDEPTLLVR